MRKSVSVITILMVLSSCTSDTYNSGDGDYSYLRADFVEAHTVAVGEADQAVNDDEETLLLTPHAKAQWMTKADTTYRGLLYYNRTSEANEPVSLLRVPVLHSASVDTVGTDPVKLQSCWKSNNKKYINLGLQLMTGKADDDTQVTQKIGLQGDTLLSPEGSRQIYLTLLHAQNGAPEYYSSKTYVSIPVDEADSTATYCIIIHTYDGVVTKTFEP